MSGASYREYLKSPRWRFTADAAKKRVHYRCQVCNGLDEGLDAHHRTYDRLGDERDEDITVLCRVCHRLFHDHKRGALVQSVDSDLSTWLKQVQEEKRFFFNACIAQADKIDLGLSGTVYCIFRPAVNGEHVQHQVILAVNKFGVSVCGRRVKGVTEYEYGGGES